MYRSGSQGRPSKPIVVTAKKDDQVEKSAVPPVKKMVDLNANQTRRNKGCGKIFKKDNHETACEYHPGPAIFHDRLRGVGFLILFEMVK